MKIGAQFAREALRRRSKRRGATVFALQGDLGAGKTTFVQGFFKGLGLKKRAPSPTFIIMRRHALRGHAGRPATFKNVFHIDAYRLKKAKDLAALDFQEIADDPQNIILIEWADRARGILPKGATWLVFAHGTRGRENERSIIMKR